MAHYRIFRVSVTAVVEGESERHTLEDIAFTSDVGVLRPLIHLPIASALGLSETIGKLREREVGITSGFGLTEEVGETEVNKGGKYFGTLQNGDEDPTGTYDSPTISDYWYSYDGVNDGHYWDTHLDPSDLDFKLTFRLNYSDILTDISTSPDLLWQCGSSVNGIDVTVVRDGDNMSYLQVTFALSSVDTQIRIMLHNLSLDTWYEMFVNSTTLSIRERDNPTVGWTVSGTLTAGDVEYYEAFGYCVGSSPSCSSGITGEVSIREIEYFGKNRLLMPTGLDTTGLLRYSAHYGTNNDGDAGKVGASGTPVVNADWVTFASSAAYYLGSSAWDLDQTDVDVYLVFRLEEDHLDTLKAWHTIWKTGNEVNGLEIGIDGLTRRFGFCSRNDSTLKENVFSIYNLELDVWYEIFCSSSKMTIREEATPANGFTQSATIDVDAATTDDFHALATSLVGHVWEGSVGSGWSQPTSMSVKKLQIYKTGELTFPADLATPVVGPQRRWTWGSDVGGNYSWASTGTVTVNTDNIEGTGSDGLYNSVDIVKYYPKPSSGWGIVVEFEADSFSSAATIWKTGDEVNGAEIGIDASGNIGFYGRSSSTLTSMYIDTSVLSTATKYFLYATASDLKIYDSVLSLVAETTGTVTTADSSGSSDNASVLVSVYGSPMTGATDTFSGHLDGRLYTLEIWEEDDLVFPPSNWHHGESEIGFSDSVDGDMNTAVEEVLSVIGFSETIGAESVGSTVGTSEGIGFDDEVNVLASGTFFSESTVGLSIIAYAKKSLTKGISEGVGFTEEVGADHIDESTGPAEDNILGLSMITGAYNATIRKYSMNTLGLNEETGAKNLMSHKESSSGINFSDEIGAHSAEKTVGILSTLGLDDSSVARNASVEVLSVIGFSDEAGAHNSVFTLGISEGIGFNGEAEVDITYLGEVLSALGLTDEAGGHKTTNIVNISEGIGLLGETLGGNPLNPDWTLDNVGLNAVIDATHYPVAGIEEEIGFTGLPVPVRQYVYGLTEEIGFNVDIPGENFGNLVPVIPESLTYKYFVTLTGANDSTTDLEIEKIKTIQLQLKETDASNVIISAVYSDDLKDAIALRTNGTLVVEMASIYHGEEIEREEIMEVDFSTVRYDLGGTSQSATINGYRVNTYDSPDIVYLIDLISMRTGQAGQSVYRFARPDIHIKPGYKVAYRDERFTADQVSFYIGDKEYYMDVRFDPNTLSGSNEFDLFSRSYVPYDRDRKFTAVLTGAADGEDDLDLLGLESLQVRLSPGAPSYVSVKVAYVSGLKDLIEDRPNGDIKINVEEAGAEAAEWLSFNFNEVSYSFVPKDRSCTLVGYRTFSFHPGDTVVLENISEKSIREGGTMVLRSLLPDITLQPMSTITFESYDYLAGEISFNFDRMTQHVDIQSYSNITVEKLVEGEIGMTGAFISNAFYPSESTSEFGMSDSPRVSINDEETTGSDSELGLSIIAVAELV